jgi:hypothetical protein
MMHGKRGAESDSFGLHPDPMFPRACCWPFITGLSSRVSQGGSYFQKFTRATSESVYT